MPRQARAHTLRRRLVALISWPLLVLLGLSMFADYRSAVSIADEAYDSALSGTVVALVLGYHHACGRLLRKFVAQTCTRSHVWFRWFNEAPVVLLLIAVVLVVVKPF